MKIKELTAYFSLLMFQACFWTTPTNKFSDQIAKQELSIQLDSVSINSYSLIDTYSDFGANYVYAYNPYMHSLDILNLTDQKISQHIPLSEHGSNKISRSILNFTVQNMDSIFIVSDQEITLINRNGEVVRRMFPLEMPRSTELPESVLRGKGLFNLYEANVYYNKGSNSFWISSDQVDKKKMDDVFAWEVLLDSDSVVLHRFPYPEGMNGMAEYFPYKNIPNIRFGKEGVWYNYPALSDMFFYDISTNAIESYVLLSELTENAVSPLECNDGDLIAKAWCAENIHFGAPYTCDSGSLLFRIHLGKGVKMEQKDASSDIIYAHTAFLSVFDKTKNLQKLLEVELPIDLGSFRNCFVVGDSLYLMLPGDEWTSDRLQLVQLSLNTNESNV